MKDVGLAAEARSSNVVIVDEAEATSWPSSPKIVQSVMTSAVLSLVGAIALAFLLDFLNNRLKTPEEVEQYLRVPNLAVVPLFSYVEEKARNNRRVRSCRNRPPRQIRLLRFRPAGIRAN